MAGPYSYATRKGTTLNGTMAVGASSCTLAADVFGTPTYKMVITIDGDNDAKAADFECTVNGTSITSMVRLNGPDVEHAIGAQVWAGLTDDQLDWIQQQLVDTSQYSLGWTPISATLTYASASSVTSSTDLSAIIIKGDKLKFTQSIPLTSYWTLDSNSNDSKGSNNGTDTNISYSAGKFSNAATFNGTTSKISIADASNLKPTSSYTLGMWFKTSSTGSGRVLFQSWNYLTSTAYGIRMYVTASNVLCMQHGNATTATNTLTGSTTVTDGSWHYVVFVFQGNVGKIFLDGNLEVYGYLPNPSYNATNYPRIGIQTENGVDGSSWNGQIDDAFLINGFGLDAGWIKAKYVAGAAQTSSNASHTSKFYVTAITSTTISLTGGSDDYVYNGTITLPYYSKAESPVDFPAGFSCSATLLNAPVSLAKSMFTLNPDGWVDLAFESTLSGAATGNVGIQNLPVAIAGIDNNGYFHYGIVTAIDSGTGICSGVTEYNSTTSVIFANILSVTAGFSNWGASYPFTWANTDRIMTNLRYRWIA